MPTFKPVISNHQRRADGSYNIKIRITHKRVSRWLPTNLTAYPSDLTRALNIKNKDLEWRCNELIREMRDTISDLSAFVLEDKDVDWVVRRIKSKLAGDTFHLDFFKFAYDYVAQSKSHSTSYSYTTALHALSKYLERESLDINEITHTMLIDFMEWVDRQPKFYYRKKSKETIVGNQQKLPGGGQASRHIMKLSHIYSKAKDRYNDEDAGVFNIPRNPFRGITLSFPPSRTGQKSLGQELMQRIISSPADDPERVALDVFILSFAMMGANLADLYEARPQEREWTYNRVKTRTRRADGAEMHIYIPRQVEAIIERLQSGSAWWLGKLHERTGSPSNVTAYINKSLHRWQERNGLPEFTFYAARKTWATLARGKAGVEKATIDECLCHVGDLRMADIYIEKDWDIINAANEKVLALFDWPTKE